MLACALCTIAFLQGTAITAVGVIKNLDIHIDVDCPAVVTTSSNMISTLKTNFAGATDNTGRGYFLENIKFSGSLNSQGQNVRAFSLFNDSIWSGEIVKNVSIEKFSVSGSASISGMELSGHAASEAAPIIVRDVQCQNCDFNLTNSQGTFALYNVRSANYNTSGLVTMTWTQPTGTAPVIGNGTITCHYNREGRKVTINATIIFGSSSSYGNNGTQYRFTVAAPYGHSPAGNINYIGVVNAINAGGLKTGVVIWPSGSAAMYIGRDGNTAFWRLDNPGIWATADQIEFTVTADV